MGEHGDRLLDALPPGAPPMDAEWWLAAFLHRADLLLACMVEAGVLERGGDLTVQRQHAPSVHFLTFYRRTEGDAS